MKRFKSKDNHSFFLGVLLLGQGAVLYANYGDEGDFNLLKDTKINLNGRVMLVRAGRISFAEKVGIFLWKEGKL